MMRKWMMVDDDLEDQEIFEIAVSEIDQNIIVLKANNGLDALNQLRDLPIGELPELIVLDLNMAVMNGWDCLKALKDDPTLTKIPVYIYTTSDRAAEKEQLFALGAKQYLTKPVNIEGIVTLIKKELL